MSLIFIQKYRLKFRLKEYDDGVIEDSCRNNSMKIFKEILQYSY